MKWLRCISWFSSSENEKECVCGVALASAVLGGGVRGLSDRGQGWPATTRHLPRPFWYEVFINIWQFINSMLCYAFIHVMMCQRFANNKTFTFYTIPTFCAFGKGQVFIIILLFSLFLSGTENHREEHIPPSSNTELFWKNRKSILNSYPLLFLNLIVVLFI